MELVNMVFNTVKDNYEGIDVIQHKYFSDIILNGDGKCRDKL